PLVVPAMTTMGDRTTIAAESIINPCTMARMWSMSLLTSPDPSSLSLIGADVNDCFAFRKLFDAAGNERY
ncbi:hypothetical protein LCGC14_2585050, partial [marine sediment metagenome]